MTADDPAERRDGVGLEGAAVCLDELVRRGQPDRVRVLDDRDRRRRVVARDPVGGVEVKQVVERRPLPSQLGGVGERSAAVGGLAIERCVLVRVLAVTEIDDLLEHQRQAGREHVAGDLVEVGRDLRVVGGDRAERLGREERAKLRRDEIELAKLGDEARIVVRACHRRDAGRVAGGRPEQGRAAHVDHLDRLVDADESRADRRRERRDVHDDDVDQPDAVGLELQELVRDVAASKNPCVDRGMKRLDLAADERRDARQVRNGLDLDAVPGEMLAGAVGRIDLHAEREEIAGEPRDPVAVGDRQKGSHPGRPPSARSQRSTFAAEYNPRRGILRPDRSPSSDPRPGDPAERSNVLLPPWDYVFTPFNPHTFPDLFTPTWVASLVLLVGLVVLYNARTRRLHRHAPYLDLYEWLLWTGICVFGLILTAAVFSFDLIVLLVIAVTGLATLVWVRFIRFPPILDAYEQKLAKQRYYSKTKFDRAEATIRAKAKPTRRSRRRR